MKTFAELGVKNEILTAISEMGYETPTPVQAAVIPRLLRRLRTAEAAPSPDPVAIATAALQAAQNDATASPTAADAAHTLLEETNADAAIASSELQNADSETELPNSEVKISSSEVETSTSEVENTNSEAENAAADLAETAAATAENEAETIRDIIALAQTGTGKTAAYGLPVLQNIDPTDKQTQVIVLSPTRELCLQIAGDLRDYSRYIDGLHVVAVYGGTAIDGQIRQLRKGCQIIVATPGRLIDLMHRGVARLEAVRHVVLDEADEMLNMGFTDSIDEILAGVPEDRQTLLFSATLNPQVERIAKSYLGNYEEVVVGSRNEGAEHVTHTYYMVQAKDKYLALKRVVDYYPRIYGIIFCRTRLETQEVADQLIRDGYSAEALHGDLAQAQRDLTMQKFRQHRTQLLVATDVAARGLDVDELTHVINYGLPDDVENYTHRSGRTGRAGRRGASISIIHLREKGKVRLIERTIGKKFEAGKLPEPEEICSKQLYRVIDQLEEVEVDETQIAPFLPEVMHKLEWLSKEELVKRLVMNEFGRFLAYYATAPAIVQPNERPDRERSPRDEARAQRRERNAKGEHQAEEGYKRLFLNFGKRDNFFAREIINLVNRYVKGKVEIGRIDLLANCSFFEVPEADAPFVIERMSHAKVGDRRVVVDWADRADNDVAPNRPKADYRGGRKFERKADGPRYERGGRKFERQGGGYGRASEGEGGYYRREKGRMRGGELSFGAERPRKGKHFEAKPEAEGSKQYGKADWKKFFED